MQLPIVDKVKKIAGFKKDEPLYFLSLAISSESVESCIWGVVEKVTQIFGTGKAKYSQVDDLQLAASTAIDKAVEESGIDASSVIFGLQDDWIQEEKIISPYAQILKDLAKDLSLEPLAFVSNAKALAHLIFEEEKTPLNAILVGVFSKSLIYSKVVSGKIVDSKIYGRIDNNLKDTTQEAVKFLSKGEVLPPRMMLYGHEDLADEVKQISEINWDETIHEVTQRNIFLHPPKIEITKPNSIGKAVAFAGATDLGFSPPSTIIERPQEATKLADYSFVEGQDITDQPPEERPPLPPPPPQQEEESVYEEEGISLKNVGLSWTSFFADFFSARGRFVTLIAGVIFIGLVLFIFAYWFFPKAKVELTVKTQPLPDTEAEIIASPLFDSVNEQKGQIPAQIQESVQKGSQKAVTTGKKLVGEKAKGKVTVFNKTAAPRSFNSGTIITSSSGQKFTLDGQISVASRSASIEGITFGKSDASVTAADIGTDSNLPSGQEFKVADFDSGLFAGRNNEAFSGGSSKEISMVSQEDRERLEKTLTNDLVQKAKSEIQGKVDSQQKLLDEAISTKAKSRSFDKEIGEESPVVSLTEEITVKATVFSNDDLKKALAEYAKSNLPEGFELVSQGDQVDLKVSELSANGDLVFKAKLQGVLIPKLDYDKMKKQIAGKSPDAVKEYVSTFPEVVSSNLILQPEFPGPLKRIPYRQSNIEISAKPE